MGVVEIASIDRREKKIKLIYVDLLVKTKIGYVDSIEEKEKGNMQ